LSSVDEENMITFSQGKVKFKHHTIEAIYNINPGLKTNSNQ